MRKLILWFVIVLLLASCTQVVSENTPAPSTATPTPSVADVTATPCPTEGEQTDMANYTKYLSTSTSDYFGVYENSGHVDGYNYGYVGNNSSLAGFYLAFKLPTDFPFQGEDLDGYTVDYRDLSSAILRLPEVNKGTRGSSPLYLRIAAITGTWNADAAFNTLPAYSSVYDTETIDNAIPSSSNYDTRYGYHSAAYYYKEYYGPTASGPWTLVYTESITQSAYNYYLDAWGGTSIITYEPIGNQWRKIAITYTPAYYDYYYLYHDIDISNVIADAIENGATGILLYFSVSSSNYDRKVFTTVLESADSRRPALFLTFDEGSGSPQVKMAVGSQWKQLAGLKMVTGSAGSKEFKELAGLKMVTGSPGSKQWKQIY